MPLHAHKHLRNRDPRLGEWIDRIGPLQLPTPPVREPYVALLEAIAHQQLAGAAARAIWGRVVGLFDDGIPCSKRMADMTEEQLRSAGLSRAKALAMKDICGRVNAGKIPSTAMIATMTDAEISAQLLEARGVGAWTVDMLLMFTLRRPDVMPVTDYGVRKGFQVLYRKRGLPTPKQLLKFSSVWQPHRSVAALYLWRIAESAKKPKKLKKKTPKKRNLKKNTPKKRV
jgi:DNA-3-methyladenine glycosylase II